MADIDVARKRRPGLAPWVVGLIVLVLLIWAITELMNTGRRDAVVEAAADSAVAPAAAAAPSPETAAVAAPRPTIAQVVELMPLGAEDLGQRVSASGAVVGEATKGGFWLKVDRSTVLWVSTDQAPKGGQQPTAVTGVLRRADPTRIAGWLNAAKYAPDESTVLVRDLYLEARAEGGAP